MALSTTALNAISECLYAQCHNLVYYAYCCYAEFSYANVIMLNVIILNVVESLIQLRT
jgi:hypothetical protein